MSKRFLLLTMLVVTVGGSAHASSRQNDSVPPPTGPRVGGIGTVTRPFRCGQGRLSSGIVRRIEVVGLTADQRLICFNSGSPMATRAIGAVSGLSGDTGLVGIDFRPASGVLYGLGNAGGVYTIDIENAAATSVSQLSVALDGTSFGIDFNPTVDRLRVVSDTGQNLRINVDTGATTEDADLLYMATAPGVTGAAYTNNDGNADTATTLFDIDSTLDQVVVQAPPNNGNLNPTGKLLADVGADVGFDIYSVLRSGRTVANIAYAALTAGGTSGFYSIDLLTGAAKLQGAFAPTVVDIAVPLNQP